MHHPLINLGFPGWPQKYMYKKYKGFSPFLRPVLEYETERESVMKILDENHTILLINVYFPFKQHGDEYKVKFLEILGCIENVIDSNPNARFIITGDWNYNIFDSRLPLFS